ncbi:MAG: ABC transporter substrate-binding protein [Dehalococcoidia bacterium]
MASGGAPQPEYRFSLAKLLRLIVLPLVVVTGVVAWRYFGDRTSTNQRAPSPPPAGASRGLATASARTTSGASPGVVLSPSPAGSARAPATSTAAPRSSGGGASPAARGAAVVIAYDRFASYLTFPYAARKGYAQGIDLQMRGFGLEEDDPPENEKYNRLRSGRYQALLATLNQCALQCDDSMLIPFVIDESAGADEWYVHDPIKSFTDLSGKSVCFADHSVSQALYLSIGANLGLLDKTKPVPVNTVDDALAGFLGGKCDSVVAWQPNTLDKLSSGGNLKPGVRKLTDSAQFRFVLDVPIFNKKWATDHPDQAQAVVDAYFRGLKDIQENPEAAASFMLDAFKNVKSADGKTAWSDWSSIAKPEDLRAQLGTLAQATLSQNRLALNDPKVLAGRLSEFRGYWNRGGLQGSTTDPSVLIDNHLLLKAVDNQTLAANGPPANASFTLATKITVPRLSDAELGRTQELAKLPVVKISFSPDSYQILPTSQRDLLNIAELLRQTPGVYLFMEGRAAKPLGAPPQETIDVAANRANAVANFLAAQPGIDINRLIVLWPKTDTELHQKLQHYDSTVEAELEQDRLVLFTLRRAGGQ